MGNMPEIENIIRETITKVLYEVSNDRSLFPLYTAKESRSDLPRFDMDSPLLA